MAEDQGAEERARKERSPSFPFIPLKRAVERAQAFWEKHRREPARIQAVAPTWDYGLKSSGLIQTIAALKQYGLLEDLGGGEDRKVQLTDLARRILLDQRPGAREDALREAAKRPRLIAEYLPKWLDHRPSDGHCISELHLDRGFTQDAAKLFLRVFDETVSYASLSNYDNMSANLAVTEEGDVASMHASGGQTEEAAEALQGGARKWGGYSLPVEPPRFAVGGEGATPPVDAYKVAMSPTGGIEVAGRLSSPEDVDKLVRLLEALKPLL